MSSKYRRLNERMSALVRTCTQRIQSPSLSRAHSHACRRAPSCNVPGTSWLISSLPYRPVPPQIDDYSMIRFVPLDLSDEQSVAHVLQHIDGAMQFGEDAEVRASHDMGEVPED